MNYTIGIDVGGTRIKAGAVARTGRVISHRLAPTNAQLGPDVLLDRMAEVVSELQRNVTGRPVGVGLGMSGAVDPKRGPVLLPGKFKGLEKFPIVPKLARKLRVPVIADNDAQVAMIAEQRFGQARRAKWAVMITIGTGLGSGVILDGRILRDPHLQFGTQLGFTVLKCDGARLCLSGARGTAEMLCSATALANAVRDGIERGIPSALSDGYWDDPRSVDFRAVMAAAKRGDRLCMDEKRVWTTNLGWLLVTAIHAYAAEIVIIGGGGAKAASQFLPALRQHVNAHLFRYPRGQAVPIVASKLGDHAGVLGAAALAWDSFA